MTKNDGLYQYSPGALLSIIIGANASPEGREVVIELARKTGIAVRQATRVRDRYELTINPPI